MIDIGKRHKYWWDYLLSQAVVPENFDRSVPGIELVTRLSRKAGKADTKRCEYNLNYACQEGDTYDETICHEICHVFALRIYPWVTHGALWHYFYNVVCESKRGKYHSYRAITRKDDRTEEMKQIKELLKLQKKLAAAESNE